MSQMHRLHPQAQDILQRIIDRGEPAFETMKPVEARRIADARVIETAGPGPEVGDVEETSIEVEGRRVALRIYRPKAEAEGTSLPVVIYYHGGGFVVGNLDTVNSLCRHIVSAVGCLAISVDYSLAPEHKFPAAAADAYGAARWIMANVEDLGGDPHRVAIAGESSGGTLVAAATQMAKRAGDDWKLVQQIMVYPALDLHADSESISTVGRRLFSHPEEDALVHRPLSGKRRPSERPARVTVALSRFRRAPARAGYHGRSRPTCR